MSHEGSNVSAQFGTVSLGLHHGAGIELPAGAKARSFQGLNDGIDLGLRGRGRRRCALTWILEMLLPRWINAIRISAPLAVHLINVRGLGAIHGLIEPWSRPKCHLSPRCVNTTLKSKVLVVNAKAAKALSRDDRLNALKHTSSNLSRYHELQTYLKNNNQYSRYLTKKSQESLMSCID